MSHVTDEWVMSHIWTIHHYTGTLTTGASITSDCARGVYTHLHALAHTHINIHIDTELHTHKQTDTPGTKTNTQERKYTKNQQTYAHTVCIAIPVNNYMYISI